MASKALTQAAVEKAKPKADRYEMPDGLLVGLRLTVQPSAAKSWCVRTRVHGKLTKITLGSYPTIGVAEARQLGRDALIKAKAGVNVTEAKREQRRKAEAAAGDTVRAIAAEYLAREGRRLRSMDQREKIFARLIFPAIGHQPIEQVSRTDVIRLLDRIEDENGSRMADYTLAVLRRLMNWHSLRSDTFRSPIVKGMTRHEGKPRSRVLSDDELARVWRAAGDGRPFSQLVRFLLLTASRRSEAAGLRWDEIEGADWILPAARNKVDEELVRPLSRLAQHLLVDIPRIEGCAYVFTSAGAKPLGGPSRGSFSRFKAAFDKACGVTGWTLHDLRRTARSLMSRAGVPTDHAERCLGHVVGGIRGVYDRHSFHREKQQAFEQLAAQIERIVNPPADNVRALRG
jgi:integrase